MEVFLLKEELNTVTIMYGVQSVMICGGVMMLLWCVDSLVSLSLVSYYYSVTFLQPSSLGLIVKTINREEHRIASLPDPVKLGRAWGRGYIFDK